MLIICSLALWLRSASYRWLFMNYLSFYHRVGSQQLWIITCNEWSESKWIKQSWASKWISCGPFLASTIDALAPSRSQYASIRIDRWSIDVTNMADCLKTAIRSGKSKNNSTATIKTITEWETGSSLGVQFLFLEVFCIISHRQHRTMI